MPIPEKTSIEALLNIIRGVQAAAGKKYSHSSTFDSILLRLIERRFPVGSIPAREVFYVIGDETLIRALETAGFGDFIDFLNMLLKYYWVFDLALWTLGEGIAETAFQSRLSGWDGEPDTLKAIDIVLQPWDIWGDELDLKIQSLKKYLNFEFVESVIARLNRLPVGFPAEAILPNRKELIFQPAPERIREEREIAELSVNQLDIGAGSIRISSDVGIYQRENGMLYVRVTIDGKLIRRSLGTKKESEALLKTGSVIKAALEDRDAKELPQLAAFVDRYLEYSKSLHRESTYEKSFSRVRKLVENLGSMRLDRISKQAVKLYAQKRLQEVSPASVNRELSLLSSIMEYAVDLDLIQENPVRKLKKLKEFPGRERYLNRDEVKKLLDACQALSERKGVGHNPILYEIVLTAILTGLRKGNLQNLKWSQVDLETGNIIIPASEHKNRKPLYFPINPYLRDILAGLRNNYPFSEYVFSKPDGTSYGDWKRSFETACKIAGLENVHFHDLRHTHATFLNMLGENEYTIRSLMGHETLAASKRYVHTPPEKVKEASEKLGNYIKSILRPKDETGN